MAFEPVTALHRATFKDNFALASQQLQSRLMNTFTFQPDLKGEQARALQLVAARTAIIDGERLGDTPAVEGLREDVFCRPRRIEDGFLNEKEDNIKLVTDITNSDLQAMAAAVQRAKDQIMAAAFFGPRFVGKYGATVEAYANPNGLVAHDYVKSGSATASGLTFPKIVRGLSLLARGEVDIERDPIFCAYTNVQMEDLYTQAQFTSRDFREDTRLVMEETTRTVISFMGVQFVRLSSLVTLPTVSGQPARRRIPLYAKSGMHYGDFMPQETNLERNPQKKYRLHAYTEGWFGACRSEDVKLVEIQCNE
jgi:hypothetical protein